MNKGQMIASLAEELGTSKIAAERFLDSFTHIVKTTVKSGKDVRIQNFGTFTKIRRKARKGRNPQNGDAIDIKAVWTPKFRGSPDYKNYLN